MTVKRKAGRRPGNPDVTKRAILEAARAVFGESGFERATIRSIAARAGVDPALVHHHFGAKQDLFVAAHELQVDPASMIVSLAEVPRAEIAQQIVRLYLTVFGGKESPALSLLRAAATNENAARMLREYLEHVLLSNASALTDKPDARLRVALIGSHMMGVIFAREVVGVPEISDPQVEDLVRVLSPMVDRYLNAPALAEE